VDFLAAKFRVSGASRFANSDAIACIAKHH